MSAFPQIITAREALITSFDVIPAKAGIQYFQFSELMDSGFRRNDESIGTFLEIVMAFTIIPENVIK
jgi:hypothetical protein